MKKILTIILLLLTFISNAQIENEKVDTKPREETISAPMLICSNENRDKIIGKVLGMNVRDVKSFINKDTKNPLTDADKIKMNKDFANLTKAKNKK